MEKETTKPANVWVDKHQEGNFFFVVIILANGSIYHHEHRFELEYLADGFARKIKSVNEVNLKHWDFIRVAYGWEAYDEQDQIFWERNRLDEIGY